LHHGSESSGGLWNLGKWGQPPQEIEDGPEPDPNSFIRF